MTDPATDAPRFDYGKSTEGFVRLGPSLEPIDANLGTDRTPVDQFFVCTVGDAPVIEPADWTLTIDGDAVKDQITIDWAALTSLPTVEFTAWLECAGNGRRMFGEVGGEPARQTDDNTLWSLNGMGIAHWRGPRLADVLALAGIADDAAWVAPMGLDIDNPEGEAVRMCMPLDRALAPTTIVAIEMNGAPLPRSHGAPARLLVPGWVGSYSVKWLGELTVSSRWVPSFRADEYYVHRDPDGTITGHITAHPVRSSLALAFPATVEAGRTELFGYARSGEGPITQVDVSIDDGPWQVAHLDPEAEPLGWTCFRFEVDLAVGDHVVRTRATDASGATQPDSQPLHPDGVLWHSVIPHPVTAG